ncbi:MAG: hypothetical protein K6T16_02720 [Candidatus Pacearchaeota archaeon]|nr:hypothetical protein [Candidatus Pacearchaeota archaeon]
MTQWFSLLCGGDNAQRALERILKAKESLNCRTPNNLQLARFKNYEAIVSCICHSNNKKKITIEEVSEATGLSVNYIKNNLRAIGLYVLDEKTIEEREGGGGKYAYKENGRYTLPVCKRFKKNYHIGSERG